MGLAREQEVEIRGAPLFMPGEKVRALKHIKNDGTYPRPRDRRHSRAQGRCRLRARHRHLPAAVLHLRGRMGRQRDASSACAARNSRASIARRRPRRSRAMKVMIRRGEKGLSAYVPKKDLEEPIVETERDDDVGRFDQAAQRLDADPARHARRRRSCRSPSTPGSSERTNERRSRRRSKRGVGRPARRNSRSIARRSSRGRARSLSRSRPALADGGAAVPVRPRRSPPRCTRRRRRRPHPHQHVGGRAIHREPPSSQDAARIHGRHLRAAGRADRAASRARGAAVPLVVDSWYDDAMRAALRGPGTRLGRDPGHHARAAITSTSGRRPTIRRAPGLASRRRTRAHSSLLAAWRRRAGAELPGRRLRLCRGADGNRHPDADPRSVKAAPRKRGFVFLGCRFHDQMLRTYARQIIKRSKGPHYAVAETSRADAQRAEVLRRPEHRDHRPAPRRGGGRRSSTDRKRRKRRDRPPPRATSVVRALAVFSEAGFPGLGAAAVSFCRETCAQSASAARPRSGRQRQGTAHMQFSAIRLSIIGVALLGFGPGRAGPGGGDLHVRSLGCGACRRRLYRRRAQGVRGFRHRQQRSRSGRQFHLA